MTGIFLITATSYCWKEVKPHQSATPSCVTQILISICNQCVFIQCVVHVCVLFFVFVMALCTLCRWCKLQSHSLWVKRGGLSLTSERRTVTVVVPDNPPRWPPMSLAWSTTWYWSWVSLSMSGTAVRRIPRERKKGCISLTFRGWLPWCRAENGYCMFGSQTQ